VTSDGGNTQYTTGISPASLQYTINGGAVQIASFGFLADNFNGTFGPVTRNDGYFNVPGSFSARNVGDVLTLKAQTLTLAANSLPAGFNPQTQQTFTGNMFIIDASTANRLTANTSVVGAVPEPSRALLLLGGLGTLLFRRRRM
jgi:hypothetical protein